MRMRTIGTVKYKGNYLPPGTEMDVEGEAAKQLLSAGAAEVLEAVPPDPIPEEAEVSAAEAPAGVSESDVTEELCQVEGVDKRAARILMDNGINSIDDLQNLTVEQLAEFKGIGKATAKKIVTDAAQFVVDEEAETDEDAGEAGDAE